MRQRPDLRFVLTRRAERGVTGAAGGRIMAGRTLGPEPADLPRCRRPRQKRAAFAAADVALAASGTVSLELAAAGTPMVIAYDMNWLSRQIIGRMLKVDTVTLVNLVSETRVIPEFIGKACQPGPIADAVLGGSGCARCAERARWN